LKRPGCAGGRELAKRRSAIDDAARVAQLAEAKRRRREAEKNSTLQRWTVCAVRKSHCGTQPDAPCNDAGKLMSRAQEIAALLQRLEEERSQLAAAATIARDTEAERIREAQDNYRAEQEQLLFRIDELRRLTEEVAAQRAR